MRLELVVGFKIRVVMQACHSRVLCVNEWDASIQVDLPG